MIPSLLILAVACLVWAMLDVLHQQRMRHALEASAGMPTTVRQRGIHAKCEAINAARNEFARDQGWLLHDQTPSMTTQATLRPEDLMLDPWDETTEPGIPWDCVDTEDLPTETCRITDPAREGFFAAFEAQLEKGFV